MIFWVVKYVYVTDRAQELITVQGYSSQLALGTESEFPIYMVLLFAFGFCAGNCRSFLPASPFIKDTVQAVVKLPPPPAASLTRASPAREQEGLIRWLRGALHVNGSEAGASSGWVRTPGQSRGDIMFDGLGDPPA